MLKIKILLIILYNFIQIYGEIDYCDKDLLCLNAAGPHIKCNNNGQFSENCPDNVKLIELSNEDRQRIVAEHNTRRNDIAEGYIPGFSPAERMALMEWSTELEEMAELNVKTCVFGHDKCRNTPNFLKSGQNLFTWKGKIENRNPKDNFFLAIENWFLEYENCNMDYIDQFPGSGKHIGHFTVMVSDRNNRVGCAGIIYTDEDGYSTVIIACNYAYNNIMMQPVYIVSVSGSGCVNGTDSIFTALCSANEIYD